MNRRRYRSPIPTNAREVVEEHYPNGNTKSAVYMIGRKAVGRRYWSENGEVDQECGIKGGERHGNALDFWQDGVLLMVTPYRRGKIHGIRKEFYPGGQLLSAEPYRNGVIHGVSKQWAEDGRLLITCTLVDGVGLDLWCDTDSGNLQEELYCAANGELGYQRLWNCDNKTIWHERFWLSGEGDHGIHREWNRKTRRMRRGYPQYYIRGTKVTKCQYLQACKADPSLPPYSPADDNPARHLPVEYCAQRMRTTAVPSTKKRKRGRGR